MLWKITKTWGPLFFKSRKKELIHLHVGALVWNWWISKSTLDQISFRNMKLPSRINTSNTFRRVSYFFISLTSKCNNCTVNSIILWMKKHAVPFNFIHLNILRVIGGKKCPFSYSGRFVATSQSCSNCCNSHSQEGSCSVWDADANRVDAKICVTYSALHCWLWHVHSLKLS